MEIDEEESVSQTSEPDPGEPSSNTFSALLEVLADFDDDLTCPICSKIFQDVRATNCGHAFCAKCISKFLETEKQCPTCKLAIDSVFPNFLLENLVALRGCVNVEQRKPQNYDEWKKSLAEKVEELNLEEVEALCSALIKKKRELEKVSKHLGNTLFKEFLKLILVINKKKCQKTLNECMLLQQDLNAINCALYAKVDPFLIGLAESCDSWTAQTYTQGLDSPKPSTSGTSRTTEDSLKLQSSDFSETEEDTATPETSIGSVSIEDSSTLKTSDDSESMEVFSLHSDKQFKTEGLSSDLIGRLEKLNTHLEDLNTMYILARTNQSSGKSTSEDGIEVGDSLDEFKETLCKVTNYSRFKTLAKFEYLEATREKNVVASVEFDKDCEIFSVAGAFKTIGIFDYSTIISSSKTSQAQYPVTVIGVEQKISCTSWSPYFKTSMAACDYLGVVSIYDVETKMRNNHFEEHQRCCWTVDHNKLDVSQLASGSDDGSVKIWAINTRKSCGTIKAGPCFSVCSVKFNPTSRNHIAIGLSDQTVQYYDLRKYDRPINTLKGHNKTVFAVRWLNSDEIISVSTDNEMKLWSISKEKCLRTFRGHINLNHFVGLNTDGDYIVTGSENNSLYLYYKGFPKSLMSYSFELGATLRPLQIQPEDAKYYAEGGYISAVAWKAREKIIITANSEAKLKILELV